MLLMMKKTLVSLSLLMMLGACASKQTDAKLLSEVWPYEFYERFNLRTILSSYNWQMKNYCGSYPKDFFTPEQLYMPNTESIVIENAQKRLVFEIRTDDKVVIIDEVKDGSYGAKSVYTIYHDKKNDDYRTRKLYIQKKENCQKYVIPRDENVSKEKIL